MAAIWLFGCIPVSPCMSSWKDRLSSLYCRFTIKAINISCVTILLTCSSLLIPDLCMLMSCGVCLHWICCISANNTGISADSFFRTCWCCHYVFDILMWEFGCFLCFSCGAAFSGTMLCDLSRGCTCG